MSGYKWGQGLDKGRYHERNHKPEPEVMWKTSAYIDIDAWEAGIVERSEYCLTT